MTNKKDLKQKLWIEVMEDYVLCAEMGHLAIDQAKHKSELRGHLSRLTDFFWNEIEQIRREDKERLVRKTNVLEVSFVYPDTNTNRAEELVSKAKVLEIIKQSNE